MLRLRKGRVCGTLSQDAYHKHMTKLINHGDTNITKAAKKNAINKKIKPQIDKAVKAAELGDKAQAEYWQANWDEPGVDNDPGIDVPLHLRGGHFTWNFEESKPSFMDKYVNEVTWVLTVVNVAILISLITKNY